MNTKTETINFYLITRPNEEPHYHCTTSNMVGEPYWTLIEAREVEFVIPEMKDMTPVVIAGLEMTRDKMRAAASAAIMEVDNQIASLLAIEHVEEDHAAD